MYLFSSGIPDQMFDLCVSYVEEAAAGRDLKLHVVLFNVDDYDAHGAIPSRYANITKTAECLRTLAHCSMGRFHWFRETGTCDCVCVSLICWLDELCLKKSINFDGMGKNQVLDIPTKQISSCRHHREWRYSGRHIWDWKSPQLLQEVCNAGWIGQEEIWPGWLD